MTSKIPNPLPVTLFPSLNTLFDAPNVSSRPSSYREGRVVRCRKLRDAESSADREAVARRFASFLLSFTGEDEVIFALHHAGDARSSTYELDDASVSQYAVYAVKQDDPDQECTVAILDATQEYVTTDFALVLGQAPSEALKSTGTYFPSEKSFLTTQKPFTVILFEDSMTVSFAGDLVPDAFEEPLLGDLVRSLPPYTPNKIDDNVPLSVLNHPPKTVPFCGTSESEHGTVLLHSEFMKRAREHPDRPALDFLRSLAPDGPSGEHDIYTYAEFDRLSSELAEHILHLTQSATLNYAPVERLQGILEETSSTIILGRGPAPKNLSPLVSYSAEPPRQWVDVTAFVAARRRRNSDTSSYPTLGLPSIKGADLAYVMYTSGSTGKPKGVQITHHAAACSISSHVEYAPQTIGGQPPRWFQFAAPTFDPSVMEIFTTLSIGGTLCFCERSTSLTDPEAVITALSATIMMATPSMAALLRPRKVPTLKHLWTMGEALGRKVIENFASDSFVNRDEGDVRYLLNAYGPTEGSINCTLQADFSVKQRGSNIGCALATCSMFVLDTHSREPRPVPLGFSGELAIGGPQVSPGYLNRPEQTAAAFVDSAKYGRLYKTGDRARVVRGIDGSLVIDFLGRITTDQVKLSGRRVDLGDIEAVIATVPAVAEVTAIAHQQRQGEKGSEQVVVCIVPREEEDMEQLLRECQRVSDAQLQPYMRPKRYFVTKIMPRSAAGKIDRKRISAMVSEPDCVELTELSRRIEARETPSEWRQDQATAEIVGILAEVTGLPSAEILPDASLQSIGLDSLRAVKFLQQLRILNISGLAINDVLATSTVEELVRLCTGGTADEAQAARSSQQQARSTEFSRVAETYRQRHLGACAEALSLKETEIDFLLPTTSTQAGMLASFLRSQQLASSGETAPASYINHSVYEIANSQDVEAVVAAWKISLARNEMLRTVFVQVDEEMSPFAQCVLSKTSEHAAITVQRYGGGRFDDLIRKALKHAESTINLERPAFRIALVSADEKNAIVLSLAHPVFDGGSLQLMVQDVEREFRRQEPLPRTSVVEAVSRHFSSDREASAAYWVKQLESNSSEPFPCLRATQPGVDKDIPDHSIVLSNLRIDELRTKSRRISSSPLAVLHAAWSLILYAYTGTTSDVTFGSVVSDRLDEDMAKCFAPTFVTVPMRVSLPLVNANSSAKVIEVARKLTKANIDALSHLHTPLSSVLSTDGGLPYDTLFAFQDFPADNAAQGGLYSNITYPPMKNDFAVMVEVWPTSSGQLELKATYDRKLLDVVAADCMVHQLDAAIHFILEQPQTSFLEGKTQLPRELSSGFAAEWSEITGEEMILHRPFERQAAERPNELAMIFEWDIDGSTPAVQMTYTELNLAAENLAHKLVSGMGTLENKVVPLCMEKCPELYIAVLGVLKAGGAWCPVDPYSPPARQRDIIKRADASTVLVAHSMSNLSAEAVPDGVQVIDITSCWTRPLFQAEEGDSETLPRPNFNPSNIAYLIFTSGTTGPPKGVPITHAAGSAAMKSLSEVIPSNPTNMTNQPLRCMQFSQFTFDVFVQDLFYTWRCGGAIISATREVMIGSFARLANNTGATHAHLTPAFGSTVPRKDVKTLRVITMIGEKLGQSVADDWGTNMLAYNTYGPAEAAVVSTVRQFGADGPPTDVRSSNVGWPLPSLGAYVIENGRPVMQNAIGELVLAGVQLSKGYWAAPEISATKMVYNEALGQNIYHTGDFCRQLADGSFDFVGRNDDLVKIAGQRVELSEIAHACRDGHPHVDQVEVLYPKRPGSETDNVLVCFLAAKALDNGSNPAAFVVQDKYAAAVAAAVLKKAESLLPKHMVPTVTLVLNKIPRTPSAKVDRKELIRLLGTVDMQQWDNAYKENNTNIVSREESKWAQEYPALVEAVIDVAKVRKEDVTANNSLAAMGLDSIKAIRLTAKLRAAGYKVSVLDVFRCRTLGEISDLLGSTKSLKNTETSVKKVLDVDDWATSLSKFQRAWYGPACLYLQKTHFKVAPTTTTQEGMLTESMREPMSYWGVHCFELNTNVDVGRLRNAWSQVVAQTEALRVAFVPTAALPEAPEDHEVDSTFIQVIYDKLDMPWSEATVGEGDVAVSVRRQLETIATKHHDAGYSQPPWHIQILDHSNKYYMVLSFHHAIYDGDSMDFLAEDVQSAYAQLEFSSDRCQLSEAMTRITLGSAEGASTAFWQKELQGFDASESGRLLNSKKSSSSSAIIHRTQEIKSSISARDFAKSAESFEVLSITAVLRVAFGQMLSELMESPDVLFAEIKSDRVLDPQLQDAVAPLVSVIPVPFRSTGSPADLIKDQHRLAREGMRNRSVRSSLIRNLTGKSASEPLYPAVFVFHPHSSEQPKTGSQLWSRIEDLVDIAVEHPLVLNAFENADGHTTLSFSIDENLMTAAQQNVFLHQIDALVTSLISHPDEEDINKLNELFPRELQSISAPRENSGCPANHMPTVWIESYAREHPTWKAVEVASAIHDDGAETVSWTYAELDKKSNQVASFIISQGASSQMIGMCLDSTLISFAVLIGIMKSGNAYVPIEKDLPQERKMFLLEDSAAPILFTSGDLFDRNSAHNVKHIIDVEGPDFLAALDQQPTTLSINDVDLEGNAYLLYTSGSTGKPKGVRVSRRNLSSFMEGQSQLICEEVPSTPGLAGKGKYLCLASRAFDVHLGETFLAWRHGLCAVSASRTMLLDDLELALKNLHVTHASFVPSLLDQTGLRPEDVPELRFLGVGGEKMTPRTQSIWASPRSGSGVEAVHQVSLINAYGPTEATIGCCSGRLYTDSDTQNIGRPLGDCVAHVLVPGSLAHVKRGMPGELCFTGSFVGNGYHNRPDATGFVEDFHGEKMYRTGDIVALMPDDTIYFLGRKDDQVKVRGQRLELGEVSEAVRAAAAEASKAEGAQWEHEKVDVQTLLLKHPDFMRQQLVAFVAAAGASKKVKTGEPPIFLEDASASSNDALIPVVKRTHPAYMVPDLIVPVSYMPLTQTSAKADTKLLKSLFNNIPAAQLFGGHHGQAEANSSEAPSARELSPQENKIAEIAQSFSATNPSGLVVRPETTIFQLGVDSLGAISVYARMKKMGYECSVATILSGATIEQLAALPLKKKSSRDSDQFDSSPEMTGTMTPLTEIGDSIYLDNSAVSGFEPGSIAFVRPGLPLQEVLVAQSMAAQAEGETLYVNHIVLELPDSIDFARLINSWDRVIAANDILRTCFRHTDKGVVQVVFRPDTTPLVWSQVRAIGDMSELQGSLGRQIVNKIETHPPIRLTLSISDNVFILSMHHALYDGESLPMIVSDVKETYLSGSAKPRPAIGALVDYISHKRTNSVDATKKYWTELLSGWSPAELATSSLPASDSTETAVNTRTFTRSLGDLERDCAKHSLTLPALMQGVFGVVLAQLHDYGIATYGAVLSGRTVPVDSIERMIAPCIVTLPQRVNLHKASTVNEAVVTSQKAGFEVLGYQHTATRDIQAWLGVDQPLFDTIFSFARKLKTQDDGEELFHERDSQMVLDYALAVECEADVEQGKLVLRAGFTSAFGSSLQADLFLEKMELLAEAVLRGEKVPVGSFTVARNLASTEPPTTDDAEWSSLESEIKEAAADFCKISSAGISKSTSFIHMGIDSVTAIRFSRKLREKGIKATASQVIRARCIGALAQQIEAKRASGNVDAAPQTKHFQAAQLTVDARLWEDGDEIESVYPCTPLQTGMLSLTLAMDPRLYSHHHAVTLSSQVDSNKLKEAWAAVVAKNDILRTAFHWRPDAEVPWAAAVHKHALIRWQTVQTSDCDEALKAINDQTMYQAHSDFADLPPVKATLIEGITQTVFVISMHHVTYDGMSVPFLFEDLQRAYLAQTAIDRPPFSHAAFAIAKTTKTASDFWSNQVQGYRGLEIPLSDAERAAETLTAAMLDLPITSGSTIAVSDVAMLAFAKALSCLVSARDVVFGQVVSGRNIAVEGAEATIGPMFNTVPFRLRLSQMLATNEEVLGQIRQLSEEAIDSQHASLADVQKAWRQQTGGVASANLFDSLFVFQKTVAAEDEQNEDLWKAYEGEGSGEAPAEYALNFEVEQTERGILVRAYSKLNEERLGAFLDDFKAAFEDAVAFPSGLALSTPKALAQVPLEPVKATINKSEDKKFDQTAVDQYSPILIQALSSYANITPDQLGLDTSIFSLGIDSISAITIVSQCKRKGMKLSVVDIVQGITVGRICELAHNKANKSKTVNVTKLTQPMLDDATKLIALSKLGVREQDIEDVLPVLSGQEYHLSAWLKSGRTMYEPSWVFRTDESLDVERLRKSWETLRLQHSVLRSSFVAISSDRAVQVVWNASAVSDDNLNFAVTDAANGLEATTRELAHKIARAPSDLFTPPARLHLVRGGAEGDAILVTVQHAAYDAWTMVRFLQQLEALYRGQTISKPTPFAEFIQHTINDKDANDLTFWRQHLAGGESTTISATRELDAPDSKKQTFVMMQGSKVKITDLESAARKCGATPQALLVMAYAKHLSLTTGTKQPTFALFHLGRSSAFEGISDLYGPTINMLPFTTAVTGADASALLSQTQTAMASRVPHEQSRLRDVLSSTGVKFNTGLNLLWNDGLITGEKPAEPTTPLLKPFEIGVPTDYSSPTAIEGRTAVDELDVAWISGENVFVDVGQNKETGCVNFGVRCDSVIFDEEGLEKFVEGFENVIGDVVRALSI
ncbi:Non-ribosomal peptide synthetase [Gnomoniopsis smithogilvyi]|uniref:Non-ribosomal peptide synthetase n=1 Tax=Gnomoniopsis smithogilvyi TaxID=1191159 RepID=A0A9W9D2Y3_9PEZI|nr:Non-ribosomal peptide synthetase [Gnomoniopsis smithogilvyi]